MTGHLAWVNDTVPGLYVDTGAQWVGVGLTSYTVSDPFYASGPTILARLTG